MADPDVPATSTSQSAPEIEVGLHGDLGDDASDAAETRPSPAASHVSDLPERPRSSGFHSPLRQHRRTPSAHHEVKETLDAVTEYPSEGTGGQSHHRINQYIIRGEIGRGSYGAVHLANDQYGNEYALKEFSKTRLRRQAQSHILRQGPHRPRRSPHGTSLNGPLSSGLGGAARQDHDDSLFYIREEIAIMKKLNHPNLVQLIEVLDDPEEDSLYMVLEMCKKGVVMKVGLGDRMQPYSEENCWCWFRDLILGIEYLHAQGVIHRDIKPDNLLLTDNDVLKVVDFGVSEMFDKPDKMMTAKSAGSPAFLPPELCVVRHGDVSGKAADIWSMGVSLYCLRYGKLPFDHAGVMEMYEAIRLDTPELPADENPEFLDLLNKLLEKDPAKRIKMAQLRDHPWVTRNGEEPLLPAEDNCAEIVAPPNELELNRAFTRKMNHLLCVMKVIHKFKAVLARHRAEKASASAPADAADPGEADDFDPAKERARAEEIEALVEQRRNFIARHSRDGTENRGQAHADAYLRDREPLYLGVGGGALRRPRGTGNGPEEEEDDYDEYDGGGAVSESPTNADFNVYDRAYGEEVGRIMANPARRPTMYLTRLLKESEPYREVDNVVDGLGGQKTGASLAEALKSNLGKGVKEGVEEAIAEEAEEAKKEVKKEA